MQHGSSKPLRGGAADGGAPGGAVWRVLALLSLLVFAGQTLLPAIHNAFTAHQICMAHGGWMHVEDMTWHQEQPGQRAGYAPGTEHEHSHCDLCLGTHQQPPLTLGQTESQLSSLGSSTAQERSTSDFQRDGADRFALAPKQGPPHSGRFSDG